MKAMSELIAGLMQKLLVSDGYRRGWIERHWREAAGDTLAKHAWPARLAGGVLYVKVDSSAWTFHLFIKKRELIARLNQLYESPLLADIRPQTGEVPVESAAAAVDNVDKPVDNADIRHVEDLDARLLACLRRARQGPRREP